MAQAHVTPEEAKRRLRKLQDRVQDSAELVSVFAKALLTEAQSRASGRPTPQAPMAAAAMGIQGSSITVLTGGIPEAVSGGSEYGSNLYRQFGPRNNGGYWLHPAAEDPATIAAGDKWLDDQVERAVRGF